MTQKQDLTALVAEGVVREVCAAAPPGVDFESSFADFRRQVHGISQHVIVGGGCRPERRSIILLAAAGAETCALVAGLMRESPLTFSVVPTTMS